MILDDKKHIFNTARAIVTLEAKGYTVTQENTFKAAHDLLAEKKGTLTRKIRILSDTYVPGWIRDRMKGLKNLYPECSIEVWIYRDNRSSPYTIIYR